MVVLLPVQWAMLGPRALICASIAYLAGLVLVELQMADWLRIPFTCSYMPGKRFVGHTMLIGLAAFVAFTFFGWAFACSALRQSRRRAGRDGDPRRRGRISGGATASGCGAVPPLVFEDVLPTEVEPLRLRRLLTESRRLAIQRLDDGYRGMRLDCLFVCAEWPSPSPCLS